MHFMARMAVTGVCQHHYIKDENPWCVTIFLTSCDVMQWRTVAVIAVGGLTALAVLFVVTVVVILVVR